MKLKCLILIGLSFVASCQSPQPKIVMTEKTEQEWLKELGPERYEILRNKGTERPFSGEYNLHFDKGTYACAGCGTQLFESDAKFESNCGWPSFDESLPGTVAYVKDTTFGMLRTEILCVNCGGHLGHVFNDGPTKTGQRYCVNSLSIEFKTQP